MPKFLIAEYAPDLRDPDGCCEVAVDEDEDADDAVRVYAEEHRVWDEGYDPVTVYVRELGTEITSTHEISVDFDPIFSSGSVRVDYPRPAESYCGHCHTMQHVALAADGAHRFVEHADARHNRDRCAGSGEREERFV